MSLLEQSCKYRTLARNVNETSLSSRGCARISDSSATILFRSAQKRLSVPFVIEAGPDILLTSEKADLVW